MRLALIRLRSLTPPKAMGVISGLQLPAPHARCRCIPPVTRWPAAPPASAQHACFVSSVPAFGPAEQDRRGIRAASTTSLQNASAASVPEGAPAHLQTPYVGTPSALSVTCTPGIRRRALSRPAALCYGAADGTPQCSASPKRRSPQFPSQRCSLLSARFRMGTRRLVPERMQWPSPSHMCDEVGRQQVGSRVTICGWVDRFRCCTLPVPVTCRGWACIWKDVRMDMMNCLQSAARDGDACDLCEYGTTPLVGTARLPLACCAIEGSAPA